MTLRALIFDVDGTLAETERDGHRLAFNRAFADAGLDWHWDEARYGELLAVTGGKERMLRHWRDVDPQAAAAPDAAARIAALQQAKTAHYVALVEAGAVRLRAGVASLLRDARAAGLRLAIATTTTPANVDALLRATLGNDAHGWFDCIGAGDVVPRKKPDPGVYRWVLERLGVDAAQCLAFEDSANGLRAARGAGLRTVVTRNDYTRHDDCTGAWADLDGLGEPGALACGRVAGAPWRGVVDVERLRAWAGAG
jgi:beta-phosphoglucomutase-like phosphatase (HAD superfamily)